MEMVEGVRGGAARGAAKLADLWQSSKLAKTLLLLAAVVLALFVVSLVSALAAPAGASNLTSQQVSGVFADVNGDGLVDFIVNAEVIVNKGPLGQ